MISIVIPSYNRAYIISRALDSISGQTYTDWECLVVDDYSSDNTEQIVNSYSEKDSRFRFLRNNRTKGAQGARNTGIVESMGDWVILFDSDNVMHPEFLNKCIKRQAATKCDIVNTWSWVIDINTKQKLRSFSWVNNGHIYHDLLIGKCYVDNSSTLIRKSLLLDIGLLDEGCPAFQEWDTHIRLSKIAKYTTIEKCLVNYITGGHDTISSNKTKDIKGYIFILSKFKNEWMNGGILQFVKYCAILRAKISLYDAENKKEFMQQYRCIPNIWLRSLIWLLSIKFKSKVK